MTLSSTNIRPVPIAEVTNSGRLFESRFLPPLFDVPVKHFLIYINYVTRAPNYYEGGEESSILCNVKGMF